MTATSLRHKSHGLLLSLVLLAVFSTGCNIFDWTHDEGGSSDAETLLADAKDALLDQKYADALRYATKGIEQDPAPMKYPELRWVASSAVLANSGISVSQIMNALTDNTPTKAGQGTPGIADEFQLLNLGPADLFALAESCPQAVAFLSEVLEALENGDISPADILGFQFDIELGFSIANLMTAFVTTLDEDADLSNGFVQDPNVTIWSNDTGYFFKIAGITPGSAEEAAWILAVLVPQWPLFCASLIGVNQAYGTAILPNPWGAVACPPLPGGPGALFGIPDETYIVGQALAFMYVGILQLFNLYLFTPPAATASAHPAL